MKCGRCPEGRQFAKGSTYCRIYGMIIRDDHEGTLESCRMAAGEREEKKPGEAADLFGLEEWPED